MTNIEPVENTNEETHHSNNEHDDFVTSHEDETEQPQVPLRRTERQSVKRKYLKDYVLFAEEE